MTLSGLATSIRTALEEGAVQLRTALDQHLPAIEALAARVESDPLLQAAEAAAGLPESVRQGLADMIGRVAAGYLPPPAAAAPAPAAPDVPPAAGQAPAGA